MMSKGIDVDGMSKHWVPDKDTEMDFNDFMANQSELLQRIASMRIFGMTYRDLASECGVSKSTICAKIKQLKEMYDKFYEEDQIDE